MIEWYMYVTEMPINDLLFVFFYKCLLVSVSGKRESTSNAYASDQDFKDILYGFQAICPRPPFPLLVLRHTYTTPVGKQSAGPTSVGASNCLSRQPGGRERNMSKPMHSWPLCGERCLSVLGRRGYKSHVR